MFNTFIYPFIRRLYVFLGIFNKVFLVSTLLIYLYNLVGNSYLSFLFFLRFIYFYTIVIKYLIFYSFFFFVDVKTSNSNIHFMFSVIFPCSRLNSTVFFLITLSFSQLTLISQILSLFLTTFYLSWSL